MSNYAEGAPNFLLDSQIAGRSEEEGTESNGVQSLNAAIENCLLGKAPVFEESLVKTTIQELLQNILDQSGREIHVYFNHKTYDDMAESLICTFGFENRWLEKPLTIALKASALGKTYGEYTFSQASVLAHLTSNIAKSKSIDKNPIYSNPYMPYHRL